MRLLAVAIAATSMTACGRDPSAPAASVPIGATRFTPGQFERDALDSARACISRHGGKPDPKVTVDGIAWYTMPGVSFVMASTGAIYEGYSGHGWIVLAVAAPDRLELTEHELAHQLVPEAIPHSSPFWAACGWLTGVGTTFTIPRA